MFWLLLAGGLVLRGIAQIAYEPALLFIDSKKYIFGTDFNNTIWGSFDPLGYSLLILRPILLAGRSLAYAALVQHVLGMAMAGALYALMLRRGVYRWLAALAVAPVLFDAYQLNAEQTIMPDVLFETLLVAGIVLLLWQPRPGLFLVILGGLALGASAPVRQVGEALIAPALIYVVFAAHGLAAAAAARRRPDGLLRAADRGLHELLRGDHAVRVRAVQHGQRVPVRAGGARGRLRHAEDPRRRAAAVPQCLGLGQPGRGRPGQRAASRRGCSTSRSTSTWARSSTPTPGRRTSPTTCSGSSRCGWPATSRVTR